MLKLNVLDQYSSDWPEAVCVSSWRSELCVKPPLPAPPALWAASRQVEGVKYPSREVAKAANQTQPSFPLCCQDECRKTLEIHLFNTADEKLIGLFPQNNKCVIYDLSFAVCLFYGNLFCLQPFSTDEPLQNHRLHLQGKTEVGCTKYISVIKTLIHLDHLWEASFIHSKTHWYFFFFKDNIHPHTHTPMVVSGETCLSSTCRLEEPGT